MTIRCYKNFTRPLAIGFDLDDTLYNNGPVLLRAEQALKDYLAVHFPLTIAMTYYDWLAIRQQLKLAQPALANDIGLTRIKALTKGLIDLGYSLSEATAGAAQAMKHFLVWRNTIDISPKTHQLLAKLADNYRLFAISNGNACASALKLDQYFEFSLHANIDMPMKPKPELFRAAGSKLSLEKHQILYIGDHPVSDVVGATRAGWQSGWFNPSQQSLAHGKKLLQLPTLELSCLSDLSQLC